MSYDIVCHKTYNMGIYLTVLIRRIDINVLESLCLKEILPKIREKNQKIAIFPLYLPYNLTELQCKICLAKYGPTGHVPDILGGTLRKQKLFIYVKNLLKDPAKNISEFFSIFDPPYSESQKHG